jgi:hypothetical protein
MYVPHILVALGLSAAAALAFTGAALPPIEPGAAQGCRAPEASGRAECELAGGVSVQAQGSRDADEERGRRHGRYGGVYADCHRTILRHFVPGYGVILHSHIGPDCAVRRATRSTGG